MNVRIFTDAERRTLARKPCCIEDLSPVIVSAERRDELVRGAREWNGTFSHLESLSRLALADGVVEFAAVAPNFRIALVNTEGSNYPRYAGLVRGIS